MAKSQRSITPGSAAAVTALPVLLPARAVSGWDEIRSRAPVRLRWLESWHLLSLDAPTVATAWLWLISRSAGVALPEVEACAMFLAVWILYAVDRLLDARAARGADVANDGLEARHRFHERHKTAFALMASMAGVAMLPLLARFPRELLLAYGALGGLLLVWLGVVHLAPRTVARGLPKELAVGLFFALAIAAPAALAAHGRALSVAMLGFGALCTLNCLFIRVWEQHASASGAVRRVLSMASALLLLAGAAALAETAQRDVFLATALASALLLLLSMIKDRLTRTTLRALADLALLTPLLFGFWR